MTENRPTQITKAIKDLQSKYIKTQLKGDINEAENVIGQALKKGLSPLDIYVKILVPSQQQIGQMWKDGEIQVADEHLATEITLQQMNRLKQLLRPKSSIGLKVVVTTIEGEPHVLGSRIISDFFYADGWDVDFLGASTPSEDLLGFVNKRKASLLAISITLEESFPKLVELIQQVKKMNSPPKVIVGGSYLCHHPEKLEECNADGFARDAFGAIQEARRVCAVSKSPASLQLFLEALGERIQTIRKNNGMSQKELADIAGLDRAYISALEHGKQNVTLGAVMKLAEALDITLEEALIGKYVD